MKTTTLTRIIVIAVAMLALGATAVIADDVLTYQGNKARITVGTIKSKAGKCNQSMAAAIGEMLSTTLVNSGRFIVLASQEELGELVEEIEFGQSEYAEAGRTPEKGLMDFIRSSRFFRRLPLQTRLCCHPPVNRVLSRTIPPSRRGPKTS